MYKPNLLEASRKRVRETYSSFTLAHVGIIEKEQETSVDTGTWYA